MTLEVRVAPALDFAGNPRKIQLLERRDGKDEIIFEAPAPSDRGLELKIREKSLYRLRLRSANGDIWPTGREAFEATGSMPVRVLEPTSERVRGLVTPGGGPLANARVTFGTEEHLESISFNSKADGRFEGLLPRLGRWRVAAASEPPHLQREVDVDLIRSDRGAELDVEVRLIPTGVEGESRHERRSVVSAAGVALPRADVHVIGGSAPCGLSFLEREEPRGKARLRPSCGMHRHSLVSSVPSPGDPRATAGRASCSRSRTPNRVLTPSARCRTGSPRCMRANRRTSSRA